jgi:hypothetical protein
LAVVVVRRGGGQPSAPPCVIGRRFRTSSPDRVFTLFPMFFVLYFFGADFVYVFLRPFVLCGGGRGAPEFFPVKGFQIDFGAGEVFLPSALFFPMPVFQIGSFLFAFLFCVFILGGVFVFLFSVDG